MHIALEPTNAPESRLSVDHFRVFADSVATELARDTSVLDPDTPLQDAITTFLKLPPVAPFLISASRADVFSAHAAESFSASTDGVSLLRFYKLLKYCYNLPCGQLFNILASLITTFIPHISNSVHAFAERILDDHMYTALLLKHVIIGKKAAPSLKRLYEENADYLLQDDPHAIFPTSIYRQCYGHVTSSDDSRVIEGVMGTSITTTIEIVRDVLSPQSTQLRDMYKPLGRCIAVVDERLDSLYGEEMTAYFAAHGIEFQKLVYRCMEVDKDISTVERILVDLKSRSVARNEPVLIVGGGVMADIGGFACALYHRNTPYVMLCTSIVSGIDAGPSPRTCCDGLGYKNVFGAYHPPILTLTDRQFFKTLHPGWIRHGIAEIIKMAVTKDSTLFDAVEEAGNRLVDTKFGVASCERGSDIDSLSESIIAKAMDGYVRSEYGNLWETHQCRPHAYGHTWSPGFELQAGLLHGHAVAIGMGYGAYLSSLEGWITDAEFHRILKVMSTVGLSLRHECLENPDLLWVSQVKMTEKRGGNLCAPVPRGKIGTCGYINDVPRARLEKTLVDYQNIVMKYPRDGLGIDAHCADVGLEDPSTVKQHAENAVAKGSIPNGNGKAAPVVVTKVVTDKVPCNGTENNIEKYNEWISQAQEGRAALGTSAVLGSKISAQVVADTAEPPSFEFMTLFHDKAEEYASDMTTLSSEDFVRIAEETEKAGLFAPCMVGKLEGQFLKMITQIKGAKRVLDIGTFTGYSALAFAEGLREDGEVVSLEADAPTAAVARSCLAISKHGAKVRVVECDATAEVRRMAEVGEKFDIVFLDADKTNYRHYYELGLQMLNEGGLLMADNILCSLVYAMDDPVRQSLHEFAQFVRADTRVEQAVLTVREGVMLVQKV